MRKMRLELGELAVESFPTETAAEAARGTVEAAEAATFAATAACGTCGGATCAGATCFTSCSPGGDPRCTCPVYL